MNPTPSHPASAPFSPKSAVWLTVLVALLLISFHFPKPSRPTHAGQGQGSPAFTPVLTNPPAPSAGEHPANRTSTNAADQAVGQQEDMPSPALRRSRADATMGRWQFGTSWGSESNAALAAFSTWAQRYEAADPAARAALEVEGNQLAQQRRLAMLDLIVADPREALAAAVPFRVRQELPASITAQLEQRISGKGDFLVLGSVPREGAPGGPSIVRQVRLGQESFTAHVFGERSAQRVTQGVSLHGVAMDGHLALSESAVRVLEPGETLPGAAVAEPVCSVSGSGSATASGAVLAASGDATHWLCRGGHIEALEHQVMAAERGAMSEGIAASGYGTIGSRRVLVMRVDFPDRVGEPVDLATAQANIDDVAAFIRSNAFQQVEFTVRDVTPVLRMTRPAAEYVTNHGEYQLQADARLAAMAAGYDTNNYEFDIVAVADVGFNWGGLGWVGAKGSWVQGSSFDRGVTAHELGHNLGVWHANAWVSQTIIGGDGQHAEYGNPFDVMGNAYNYPRNHYSSNFKFVLGWLPESALQTVTASGTYRVHAHDVGGTLVSDRKYGLRIPMGFIAAGESMDYWIEHRQGFDPSGPVANGAVIQWGNDQGSQFASRLLDTRPDSLWFLEDAPLVVGRTFTDALNGVTISTLAQAGSGADSYLDIEVRLTTPPQVSLVDALDLAGATWTSGGDRPWTGQQWTIHDGVDAAASGRITNNQSSYVETTVTGPGTISYWWKVASEQNYDFFSFLVDGLEIRSISGDQDWQQITQVLPAGTHALRWRYAKDEIVSSGADQGWLDEVTFMQPPSNDLFSARPSLTGAITVTGSNRGATKESGEPNHGGAPGGKSVWWRWTSPVTGPVSITTAGSSFDTLLGVYRGSSVNNLTRVAGNDNHLDSTSAVLFSATSGNRYEIAVDGYDGASGDILLNIALGNVLAPANDLFARAIVINPAPFISTVLGQNAFAAKESGEPDHADDDGGASVWWQWAAPYSGTVNLDTAGSSFDTLLAVYTGSAVGSLRLIAENDNASGVDTSALQFTAVAGTTYRIAVDGEDGDAGSIQLTVHRPAAPPPAHDAFAHRQAFIGSGTAVDGSNESATKETGEPAHGGNAGGRSVWWTWTAPADGLVRLTTRGSSFDTLLGVYTGSAVNALTLVAGGDDDNENSYTTVTIAARAGATYHIAVDGYGGSFGQIHLALERLMPLRMLHPMPMPDGSRLLWIGSIDGQPVDPSRAAHVRILTATNISQPLATWTPLSNPVNAAYGFLYVEDTTATNAPFRFYRASEMP